WIQVTAPATKKTRFLIPKNGFSYALPTLSTLHLFPSSAFLPFQWIPLVPPGIQLPKQIRLLLPQVFRPPVLPLQPPLQQLLLSPRFPPLPRLRPISSYHVAGLSSVRPLLRPFYTPRCNLPTR